MNTNKTGLEQFLERLCDLGVLVLGGEAYCKIKSVRKKANEYLAAEKSAMEKAQGQKLIAPTVAQDSGLVEMVRYAQMCYDTSVTGRDDVLAVDVLTKAKELLEQARKTPAATGRYYPQSVEAQKSLNPVVAAHNEALGPLRMALWEMVEEMEANIKERGDYAIMARDMVYDLKKILSRHSTEGKENK